MNVDAVIGPWHREPRSAMGLGKRWYDDVEKARVVARIKRDGVTVAKAAEESGISRSTIRRWLRQAQLDSSFDGDMLSLFKLTLALVPSFALWLASFQLGWRSGYSDGWFELSVQVLLVVGFNYYGFVVHVLLGRISWENWLRHIRIAAPLFSAALALDGLRASPVAAWFVENLTMSVVQGWVEVALIKVVDIAVSGIFGGFAYDFVRRRLGRKRGSASGKDGQ